MAMTSLHTIVEQLAPTEDGFVIQAPEDWGQGRTLYGGMTAALAYEAVRRSHSDLPPLRSAQVTFIGPASGRLRFQTTLMRRGRSSSIIAADCFNEEGPAARVMFVFGAARESTLTHEFLKAPTVPPPADSRGFRKEGPGAPPGFWNNFECKLAHGGRMLEPSAPRPEFTVWTRYRDPGAVDPTTALIAIADCLPPAAMVHFPKPAPISSMTWTIDVTRTPQSAAGWHLLWSSSEHAADGYSMQAMTIWDESGAPLAVGRQAVAIFI